MRDIEFGKCLLLELLHERGMTQAELAEKNRHNRIPNIFIHIWQTKNVIIKCRKNRIRTEVSCRRTVWMETKVGATMGFSPIVPFSLLISKVLCFVNKYFNTGFYIFIDLFCRIVSKYFYILHIKYIFDNFYNNTIGFRILLYTHKISQTPLHYYYIFIIMYNLIPKKRD